MKRILAVLVFPFLLSSTASARSLASGPVLSVSQNALPSLGSVPQGAQRVPLLSARLRASCSTGVSISAITIQHKGLGPVADFLRVYAMIGTQRVSRGFIIPARDPLVLPLLRVGIPSCGFVDLTLYGDLSPNASVGAEHAFSVTHADAAGATVSIGPVNSSAASRIIPQVNPPAVVVQLLDTLLPVNYGANQTVLRLSLTGQGGRDQRVAVITLTNEGSATDADLQNLYFETADGKRISSITKQMSGKTVRIILSQDFPVEGARFAGVLIIPPTWRCRRREFAD